MKNKLIISTSLLLSTATLLLASTVLAEEKSEQKKEWVLEEVSVTAQRRVEKSQDVPMSIMALNAEALEKIGFSSLNDIADKIPTLSIQPDFERASDLKVYIRGVGQEKPGNFERDSGVGIYLDDIYVGHGNGLATELNDIKRIEVLAGPQGILYGRNTMGGAVKFISIKPSGKLGFKQKLDAGNYGLFRSVSTIDLDRIANISSKFTLLKSKKDGWIDNIGTAGNPGDKDATGYRAALRWTPNDAWTIDYTYDHMNEDSVSNYQQHGYPKFAQNLTALPTFSKRQDKTWRSVDIDIHDDFKSSGHALTAVWEISENTRLKSITGYRDFDADSLHDGVESFNISTLVAAKADQNQFSQEFLLSGFNADRNIKYHIGLYYFKESATQKKSELVSNYSIASAINDALIAGDPIVAPELSDLKPFDTYKIENKSQAIYAQLTWTPPILEDRLVIDIGARYTEDNRYLRWNKPSNAETSFKVDAKDSVNADSFDPAFTIDYSWTDNIHTYFRYAQAYRSGGFDTGAERLQNFDPEDLKSYEIGLKSKLLDNHFILNLAIFKLDYTNIQVQFFDPGLDASQPPAKVTVNAAEAKTKGAEIELKYIPINGLILSGSAAYLDSDTTVTNPFTGDTADRPLFNTPKLKYNLSIEYDFQPTKLGDLTALITYDYRDEELAAGSSDPTDMKPDYGLIGARLILSDLSLPAGDLSITFWGKNLADEEYEIYHNFGSVIYGEPRNYGISVIYNY